VFDTEQKTGTGLAVSPARNPVDGLTPSPSAVKASDKTSRGTSGLSYPIVKVFDEPGDFRANEAAERWLDENGYSVGRMQGSAPRGILRGDFDIQKWRNLSDAERDALHGTMTGDFRDGPITVRITK
jgi:hypothetical protein